MKKIETIFEITSINAIESFYKKGPSDPWFEDVAGRFADLFIYSDITHFILPIPEEKENFKEFCNQMAENENKLKEIMLKEKSLSNSYAS